MTGVGSAELLSNRLGSYELLRPLAQGGMAEIYLARRADAAGAPGGMEHHVALKVLSKARASDPEACAMFRDEARLVGMLDHHNIASLLEVDVFDGNHFLAMEYVDGADLRAVLIAAQRTGHQVLPYDAALSIVCAAAAGLDHAHRRCGPDGKHLELVHRDVSLSNIMVGHDGAVKVVDFGIASTTIASVRTMPGMVRGKASYMSPEQCLGEAIDHRSDVFGLGVVLYELTTGMRCFHGKTDFDRMLAVVRNDYTPPDQLIADYPDDLAQVIRTALAGNPVRRFASAAAMIEALAQVAAAHGWIAGPGPIQRVMRSLFPACQLPAGALAAPPLAVGSRPGTGQPSGTLLDGIGEAHAPSPSPFDDGPATELCAVVAPLPVAEPTRPARRLARGTRCNFDDDLDERTRGRGPLRRPGRPGLAA